MNFSRFLQFGVRMISLLGIIVTGFLAYPVFLIRFTQPALSGKIAWMQWMSRRFLRLLGGHVSLQGDPAERGLVVCNHLGYVDILAIGSVCPALFVAKSDVKAWPLFGWLAALSGTLFVRRSSRLKAAHQVEGISSLLAEGHPLVLFPEGTSSDGRGVLPFRSSLLQAALSTGSSITPASITYRLKEGGGIATGIAYWGEMTFLPHLLGLLTGKPFVALLDFGTAQMPDCGRKEAALQLHAQVAALLENSNR